MAAGRQGEGAPRAAGRTAVVERGETVRFDVPSSRQRTVVDMHLSIARRLFAGGEPVRAFQELVRGARAEPMTPRLAAALARIAPHAHALGPATTLLEQGLDEVEHDERLLVFRCLVRLSRKGQDLERACEFLVQLLAERPGDRRARFVLNALLERQGRWEELDASLERETRDAFDRGALRTASRVALRRARLHGERLADPGRAALRYAQAAEYAEQGRDFESGFLLRLLWLRCLLKARAPQRAVTEALEASLKVARRLGKEDRVHALLAELQSPRPALDPTEPAGSPLTVEMEVPDVRPKVSAKHAGPRGDAATAPPRRRSTQLELMAIADSVAQAKAHGPELTAMLAAAADEGFDPAATARLEAHLVARGDWRGLAQLYRDAAARASVAKDKASYLTRLAEVQESELDDAIGASKTWAEVVSLTGDEGAASAQVRLLEERQDDEGVRAAIDHAVTKAKDAPTRALALVRRADHALTRRELASARADFEAALKAHRDCAPAAAGFAELCALDGDFEATRRLAEVLGRLSVGEPSRGDLYRRLARLVDAHLRDPRLAQLAWGEVLEATPGDEEAFSQLTQLAEASGNDEALITLLETSLSREPSGPRARESRLALTSAFDRLGDLAEAVEVLREAVAVDPAHLEAWLALTERLQAQGDVPGAAEALARAVEASPHGPARRPLLARLERLYRQLGNAAAAEEVAQKLGVLVEASGGSASSPLLGGPLTIPAPRKAGPPPRDEGFEQLAKSMGMRAEPEPDEPPPKRLPSRLEAQLEDLAVELSHSGESPVDLYGAEESSKAAPRPVWGADEVYEEVGTGDIEVLDDDFVRPSKGSARERSATQELSVELGDPGLAVAPSFGPSPAKALTRERQALFERVRGNPLDADGYRMLAEHFDSASDPSRSSLMLEIARGLEGDPDAAPRAPRLILSHADRAGLRHPMLRGDASELLMLVGEALCRLYPSRGREAGTEEELALDQGKGARATADALLVAVRVLGARAPQVVLSEDAGPPFSIVYAEAPRVLVGKGAVKKSLADAELRFFAGRALFTLQPDLMALRTIRREHLYRGLAAIGQVASGQTPWDEARVIREAIARRSWERLKALFPTVGKSLDVGRLAEGARHSANRAGLVVCGGVAPAIAALQAKRALPQEIVELVRFAASERYLQLRTRRLGRT